MDDTIKLLRECDAGIKMGIASIDKVLDDVQDEKAKEIANQIIKLELSMCDKLRGYL